MGYSESLAMQMAQDLELKSRLEHDEDEDDHDEDEDDLDERCKIQRNRQPCIVV